MGTTTSTGTLFKPELVTDMFSKVKGHSTLAKLCGATPVPFAGTDTFVFSMDGEASIVGEGGSKPAGNAELGTVTIKPIKFVYQHRITDEFVKMSEEKQLPYTYSGDLKARGEQSKVTVSTSDDWQTITVTA